MASSRRRGARHNVDDAWRLPRALSRRLWGVVIGNSAYRGLTDQDLPKCTGDADAMARCLVEDLRAPESHVTTLHNASKQDMVLNVEQMLLRLESGATALVYFSGHGRQCDGDVRMMASGAGGEELSLVDVLERTTICISRERNPLVDVTLVVLLDCCRSLGDGASAAGVGLVLSRPGSGVCAAWRDCVVGWPQAHRVSLRHLPASSVSCWGTQARPVRCLLWRRVARGGTCAALKPSPSGPSVLHVMCVCVCVRVYVCGHVYTCVYIRL